MTPLITFIILITGFIAGSLFARNLCECKQQSFMDYFFKARISKSASPFSLQDAKKGREAVANRIEKRKARIMERAHKEGKVTNDDIEDLFCISDSTARNYLNELEKEGKLTQQGATGRGVYYTPTSS